MTDNVGPAPQGEDDRNKPIRDWSWSADDQNLTLGIGVLLFFLLGAFGLSQCSAAEEVADDLGISVTDDDLLERTEAELEDASFEIGGDGVTAKENLGVITLSGVVANEALKARAGEVASATDGVARVQNNLTIATTVPPTTNPPATTQAPPPPTTQAPPPPTTTEAPAPIDPVAFTGTFADNALTITGEVPDEATRAQVIDGFQAQYAPAGITVIDELTINENTTLEGGTLDLIGEVSSEDAKAAVVTNATKVADSVGMTVNDQLTIGELSLDDEVVALQVELDALQAEIQENVVFDPASDAITPTAAATLDKVVAAMTKYQRPVVEVGGHTDSDGSDTLNLELSARRAEAVAAYLVDGGIDTARLIGTGFGESDPVAPNDTDENKLKNRRVQFTARPTF